MTIKYKPSMGFVPGVGLEPTTTGLKSPFENCCERFLEYALIRALSTELPWRIAGATHTESTSMELYLTNFSSPFSAFYITVRYILLWSFASHDGFD